MHLNHYTPGTYTPGVPLWQQLLWYYLGDPIVRSYLLPFSALKVWTLKRFGANLGQGIRIKPGVKIKFPWRLIIGNYCWIGENAWIDNLAPVTLDDNVCLSQGVYLCTGNHNWSSHSFDLQIAPIHIQSSVWIGAQAVVGPGVTIGQGAVLTLGSVTPKSLAPMIIYSGNPAQPLKPRTISPLSPQ